MDIAKFLESPMYKTIEHMIIVGIFVGLSATVTELITLLANDKTIAQFVTSHGWAVALLMLVNMGLAGLKRYIELKKEEVEAGKTTASTLVNKISETQPANP